MKILLIDVNAEGSSTGHIVHELYKGLISRGDDALVCFARGQASYPAYKFALNVETHIHALLTRITGYTDCFSPISTLKLISKIKKFDPDIIHIHELHSYFLNSKMFWNYLAKSRAKILWTMHCDIAYTGRCGVAANCDRYKKGCGNCPRLHSYPKTLFFDRSKYLLNKKKKLYEMLNFNIVAPSMWLANRMKGSIVQNKAISISANGIDDSFFSSEPSNIYKNMGIYGDVFLFTTPKYSDKNKGVDRLISIASKLKNINFCILALDYKGEIRIADNVYCIGGVNNPKSVGEYMASAKCYISLSEYESFSLTIAQSLASGTPVIAYKCGAPESIYTKYVEFIDFGDENAIISAIKKACNMSFDRNELREYAQQFSMRAMCDRYIKEYLCLLEDQNI